jgi:hypothetical protein
LGIVRGTEVNEAGAVPPSSKVTLTPKVKGLAVARFKVLLFSGCLNVTTHAGTHTPPAGVG